MQLIHGPATPGRQVRHVATPHRPRARGASPAGFTLVELMIVVVVIGVLAAIALPNFLSLRERANEAGVKRNMHTLQLVAEDYGVLSGGEYSDVIDATHIANMLPNAFANPYNGNKGSGAAWEDRAVFVAPPNAVTGIVSYADSATTTYNVKGYGKGSAVSLVLTTQ